MKKRIVYSVFVIAICLGVLVGYRNINHKYPERQTVEVTKGEKTKFTEGIDISVIDFRWFSEEEKKELYHAQNIESETLFGDEEICEITVILENCSQEKKEFEDQYLMLESTGISNGYNFVYEKVFPERYGIEDRTLEPWEKRSVTHLYSISSLWFHDKEWEDVKEREYWLTFTSYPLRTILWLQ